MQACWDFTPMIAETYQNGCYTKRKDNMYNENCIFDMYTADELGDIKTAIAGMLGSNIPDEITEENVFDCLINFLNGKVRRHKEQAEAIRIKNEINLLNAGSFDIKVIEMPSQLEKRLQSESKEAKKQEPEQ